MRTFELLLWLVGSTWTTWWMVSRPSRTTSAILAGASIIVAALDLGIEGARFHMVPTYALVVALIAAVGVSARRGGAVRRPRRWVRAVLAVPVTLFLVSAVALPSMFPVFEYEPPVGRYGIGTADYELKGAPHDRDLVVQTWYPIAPGTTGPRAGITSHPEFLEAADASFTGLPKPLFDSLRLVKTHAIVRAPLTQDQQRLPVVLFSHGPLSANRSQSIFQMEALASRGFVVIAIDHTGYASTTIFPDGHAVPPDPDAGWPVFVDSQSTRMLTTWVADVRFVIDQLHALDAHDPTGLLTGRLDLSRIGYLGASFGGSVVVQALLDEPRIKAGLAQDGKPYFLDAALTDLKRPLMYMQSMTPYIAASDAQLSKWGLTTARFKIAEQDHYTRQMRLFAAAKGPIYNVYIRGTNHLTFSDLYLMIRLPDSQMIGVRRAQHIINDYTIAFFNQHLNGSDEPLLDATMAGPYSEVTVASRNGVASRQVAQR
jgi:predicted dienelactone hydrolase